MLPHLACFNPGCGQRYPLSEIVYSCGTCGSLLEVANSFADVDPDRLRAAWRQRRSSLEKLDVSGVWRFREMLPFASDADSIVTLPEGNTPLFDAPAAASYAGLDSLQFKHQGYNPTASFKDNGMTAGVTQARILGMRRVACVSTGNTSASMAAYAAAAGMQAVIFLPAGNIAHGKLAQALEYGALTVQVEANFDQILALVRDLAGEIGIYLLNSVNPFRIEGQKSIAIEMLEQRRWIVPDWIVLPGGNLGNVSALGKALRELREAGLIDDVPRIAVVQAEGSAPFYRRFVDGGNLRRVETPETLATAIRIGDPVSWKKGRLRGRKRPRHRGIRLRAADRGRQGGHRSLRYRLRTRLGPATLAGIRKLVRAGTITESADVTGILTGHLLKDPDYVYHYHSGQLETPSGYRVQAEFGNPPVTVPNDRAKIAELLDRAAARRGSEPAPAATAGA